MKSWNLGSCTEFMSKHILNKLKLNSNEETMLIIYVFFYKIHFKLKLNHFYITLLIR